MARARDLYEVLGLRRDASAEEIKRAYRRLARELHPDVSDDPEAEHKFKEINLAYQTLSDPEKRRVYDLTGGEEFTPDMFSFMGDISEVFEAFFGAPFGRRARRAPRTRARRGRDLWASLDLTFEEAAQGIERELRLETTVVCERCGGAGAEPGTSPERCAECRGRGEVQEVRQSIFGTMVTARTCPVCGGAGDRITSRCADCGGTGTLPASDSLTIDVPPGVADGMELRVEGRGEAGGSGGPPGDLYVALRVAPHPLFQRRGQDLVCVLEMPVTQALLGAEVRIPTLDGDEVLRVAPGTRSGTVLRLSGRGLPHPGRRGRGDLFVEVDVEVPSRLSKAERRLVEELAASRGEDPKGGPTDGRIRRPG